MRCGMSSNRSCRRYLTGPKVADLVCQIALARFGKVCVLATSCHYSPSAIPNTAVDVGRRRWVVERTFAWLNQFRRLRMRYEKRVDIHEAFLALACALLCWRSLQRSGPGAIE